MKEETLSDKIYGGENTLRVRVEDIKEAVRKLKDKVAKHKCPKCNSILDEIFGEKLI